jgi:AcrR family transcriptional regulator
MTDDATARSTITGAPARDDTRARLLAAAARVYASHGYLGATTRAIAADAGVNEVTLFRIFGDKETLLDDAIAATAGSSAAAPLPVDSRDPMRELTAWCRAELARLREGRGFIRKCFADSEEHPNHVRRAAAGIDQAADELRRYAARLVEAELARATPRQRDTAVTMLLSTLIADALGRDEMDAVFRVPATEAPRRYAAMFLAAIGVESTDR